MRTLLILLVLLTPIELLQAQEAEVLISGINRKFANVQDYQADVVIDTKISFLNILPQKAKVFYKKPSQFKIKAQGIAILPKQNFDDLFELLATPSAYSAFATGSENLSGNLVRMVQVIPHSDTTDLVLARLWIDPVKELIIKSQLTTRSNGTVLVQYTFGKYADYALPDRMDFTVELKKFKLPKVVSADINTETSPQKNAKDAKTGTISIELRNYLINKGLTKSVFE